MHVPGSTTAMNVAVVLIVSSDGEDLEKIMTLRRHLRSVSVTDAALLSPPSSTAQLLAGNSSADTESSMGAETESEWTYLLTTDDQLNQSVRKEFYYDEVSISTSKVNK